MASIRPFKAVRPVPDKVHLVATRSYVTYSPTKLRDKLDYNPYSFIHIINPEFGHRRKSRPNSDKRFIKVRQRYDAFIDEGVYQKDENPSYYVYRQIHHGHQHTGVICGVACDDYIDGKVKIHEQTLGPREEIFKKYLEMTHFNAEPVLLTFPDEDKLHNLLQPWTEQRPVYDFSTADKVRHQLWQIDEESKLQSLKHFFAGIPELYIADGHHRCASSVLLAQEKRKRHENQDGLWNFFMAYILPSKDLLIHPFHRLISNLGVYKVADFLAELNHGFEVIKLDGPAVPAAQRQFCMYLESNWYNLSLKNAVDVPVEETDSQLLTDTVLKPLLQILDIRHDERLSFIGGEDKALELKAKVDKGWYAAAFILHPVTFDELKAVSDAGLTMPPKSTYIEPKLRSGLTIFELDD